MKPQLQAINVLPLCFGKPLNEALSACVFRIVETAQGNFSWQEYNFKRPLTVDPKAQEWYDSLPVVMDIADELKEVRERVENHYFIRIPRKKA